MYFQTKTLPISQLDNPIDARQRHVFQSWHDGTLADTVMAHPDDLVILTVEQATRVPAELYKGQSSIAARVLGEEWQSDFAVTSGAEKILEAYNPARFGEPTFQYVAHSGKRGGNTFEVAYERLVLPFKNFGGALQFVTLASLVSFEIQPIGGQSPDNEISPFHTASSQILLGKDERSSSVHLGSG